MINVTGRDRPGITAALSNILAQYQVRVLDIDQAVIQNNLAWGMLVHLPPAEQSDALFRALLFEAHSLDMDIRLTPVTHEEYAAWANSSGQSRHIITLIGRQILASHISAVAELVSRFGLNIQSIKRLSGRAKDPGIKGDPATESEVTPPIAIELGIRGQDDNLQDLRSECLQLARRDQVDIAIQKDDIHRRNRRLVCFDMDSTLIQNEVIDELASEAGVLESVSAITRRAMDGELDFQDSFRERLALLKGLDQAALDRVANRLTITEGASRLVENLKRIGLRTAIVSGGFTYFASRIQQQLGIDYVVANELELANGEVTGNVTGDIVDDKRKALALRDLALREGIQLEQVIAVGDGANDIPMLSIAGLGIAFRAKPALREHADYAVEQVGLDAILYLIGMREAEVTGG